MYGVEEGISPSGTFHTSAGGQLLGAQPMQGGDGALSEDWASDQVVGTAPAPVVGLGRGEFGADGMLSRGESAEGGGWGDEDQVDVSHGSAYGAQNSGGQGGGYLSGWSSRQPQQQAFPPASQKPGPQPQPMQYGKGGQQGGAGAASQGTQVAAGAASTWNQTPRASDMSSLSMEQCSSQGFGTYTAKSSMDGFRGEPLPQLMPLRGSASNSSAVGPSTTLLANSSGGGPWSNQDFTSYAPEHYPLPVPDETQQQSQPGAQTTVYSGYEDGTMQHQPQRSQQHLPQYQLQQSGSAEVATTVPAQVGLGYGGSNEGHLGEQDLQGLAGSQTQQSQHVPDAPGSLDHALTEAGEDGAQEGLLSCSPPLAGTPPGSPSCGPSQSGAKSSRNLHRHAGQAPPAESRGAPMGVPAPVMGTLAASLSRAPSVKSSTTALHLPQVPMASPSAMDGSNTASDLQDANPPGAPVAAASGTTGAAAAGPKPLGLYRSPSHGPASAAPTANASAAAPAVSRTNSARASGLLTMPMLSFKGASPLSPKRVPQGAPPTGTMGLARHGSSPLTMPARGNGLAPGAPEHHGLQSPAIAPVNAQAVPPSPFHAASSPHIHASQNIHVAQSPAAAPIAPPALRVPASPAAPAGPAAGPLAGAPVAGLMSPPQHLQIAASGSHESGKSPLVPGMPFLHQPHPVGAPGALQVPAGMTPARMGGGEVPGAWAPLDAFNEHAFEGSRQDAQQTSHLQDPQKAAFGKLQQQQQQQLLVLPQQQQLLALSMQQPPSAMPRPSSLESYLEGSQNGPGPAHMNLHASRSLPEVRAEPQPAPAGPPQLLHTPVLKTPSKENQLRLGSADAGMEGPGTSPGFEGFPNLAPPRGASAGGLAKPRLASQLDVQPSTGFSGTPTLGGRPWGSHTAPAPSMSIPTTQQPGLEGVSLLKHPQLAQLPAAPRQATHAAPPAPHHPSLAHQGLGSAAGPLPASGDAGTAGHHAQQIPHLQVPSQFGAHGMSAGAPGPLRLQAPAAIHGHGGMPAAHQESGSHAASVQQPHAAHPTAGQGLPMAVAQHSRTSTPLQSSPQGRRGDVGPTVSEGSMDGSRGFARHLGLEAGKGSAWGFLREEHGEGKEEFKEFCDGWISDFDMLETLAAEGVQLDGEGLPSPTERVLGSKGATVSGTVSGDGIDAWAAYWNILSPVGKGSEKDGPHQGVAHPQATMFSPKGSPQSRGHRQELHLSVSLQEGPNVHEHEGDHLLPGMSAHDLDSHLQLSLSPRLHETSEEVSEGKGPLTAVATAAASGTMRSTEEPQTAEGQQSAVDHGHADGGRLPDKQFSASMDQCSWPGLSLELSPRSGAGLKAFAVEAAQSVKVAVPTGLAGAALGASEPAELADAAGPASASLEAQPAITSAAASAAPSPKPLTSSSEPHDLAVQTSDGSAFDWFPDPAQSLAPLHTGEPCSSGQSHEHAMSRPLDGSSPAVNSKKAQDAGSLRMDGDGAQGSHLVLGLPEPDVPSSPEFGGALTPKMKMSDGSEDFFAHMHELHGHKEGGNSKETDAREVEKAEHPGQGTGEANKGEASTVQSQPGPGQSQAKKEEPVQVKAEPAEAKAETPAVSTSSVDTAGVAAHKASSSGKTQPESPAAGSGAPGTLKASNSTTLATAAATTSKLSLKSLPSQAAAAITGSVVINGVATPVVLVHRGAGGPGPITASLFSGLQLRQGFDLDHPHSLFSSSKRALAENSTAAAARKRRRDVNHRLKCLIDLLPTAAPPKADLTTMLSEMLRYVQSLLATIAESTKRPEPQLLQVPVRPALPPPLAARQLESGPQYRYQEHSGPMVLSQNGAYNNSWQQQPQPLHPGHEGMGFQNEVKPASSLSHPALLTLPTPQPPQPAAGGQPTGYQVQPQYGAPMGTNQGATPQARTSSGIPLLSIPRGPALAAPSSAPHLASAGHTGGVPQGPPQHSMPSSYPSAPLPAPGGGMPQPGPSAGLPSTGTQRSQLLALPVGVRPSNLAKAGPPAATPGAPAGAPGGGASGGTHAASPALGAGPASGAQPSGNAPAAGGAPGNGPVSASAEERRLRKSILLQRRMEAKMQQQQQQSQQQQQQSKRQAVGDKEPGYQRSAEEQGLSDSGTPDLVGPAGPIVRRNNSLQGIKSERRGGKLGAPKDGPGGLSASNGNSSDEEPMDVEGTVQIHGRVSQDLPPLPEGASLPARGLSLVRMHLVIKVCATQGMPKLVAVPAQH